MRDPLQPGLVQRLAFAVMEAMSFSRPRGRTAFLTFAAWVAGAFLAGWAIQWTGLLAPGIARGNEVVLVLFIALFFPINAAIAGRLANTVMPGWLVALPYVLFAAAEVSDVVLGMPTGWMVLRWIGWASVVAIAVGVLLPGLDNEDTDDRGAIAA